MKLKNIGVYQLDTTMDSDIKFFLLIEHDTTDGISYSLVHINNYVDWIIHDFQ